MKTIRIISASILLIVAANALAAGYSFITDPSGSGLHISTEYLRHSPFTDFFIPGIVLFVVNGVLNLVAAIFLMFRWKPYISMLFIQGMLLGGWIAVQATMLREFNVLHGLFLTTAALLVTFAFVLQHAEKKIITPTNERGL